VIPVVERQAPAQPLGPARAFDPAYVLCNAGSTGHPHGVVVSDAGVAGMLPAQLERAPVDADSRVLHFASPSFDVAFWDLAMGLFSAGTLVVAPAERLQA
ncbi:hypothetical protein VM98_39310, partial [Streptomyces rubellomurinus subsp. indigoferus]